MPKVHKSSRRKGNIFTHLWKWFLGTHFITKSVIVFGIAVTLALPAIFQANWNFPTTTKAYGWLGRCGGGGADICTTQPWLYHGVIYSEQVPGNQCAINGTNAGLRGYPIYCCGHNPGSAYGTCAGNNTCTISSNCENLLLNFSFETPGPSNSITCPDAYSYGFPADNWDFNRINAPQAWQTCAQRVTNAATDGSASINVTVIYNGIIYPSSPQSVQLTYDGYNTVVQPQQGYYYRITFDAKAYPIVPGDASNGIVDVYLIDQYGNKYSPPSSRFANVGANWQNFQTGEFQYDNRYSRIVFDFGEKSQKVWIDNTNLQEMYPQVGNIYSSVTDHTACGIQATQGGWPRGTTVYCVVP